MTPERWKQIKEIIEAAAEMDGPERDAFVNERCSGDVGLRDEVESLLAAEAVGSDALESDAFAMFSGDGGPVSMIGERIGQYEIISELGTGGMGAVFLARRTDETFEQNVAIKLIKRGMDSEAILARFINERRILASLGHPNISRLLDGGTTASGLPFFIMEHVEGVSILDYADKNRLDLNGRLDLFDQVCSAVAFAHQNLVIHRDLKPSNILVTSGGVVKLLDFGIAKLLNTDETGQTATRNFVFTPEYASPEQVRGDQLATTTDVYSLGVVLFELLTGTRPYRTDGQNISDVLKAVCETPPARPSDAVSREKIASVGRTAPDAGATTEHIPIANPGALKGDLDNILLKALRKEPERRYTSVEQFADDIRRHRKGLPVTAVKDTLGYRTSKFLGRNKLAVAAAALILITLSAGLFSTLYQRNLAQRRFNDVRQLANSFLFELHDEIENLPGSTPARELVAKRALQYLDQLSEESAGDDTLLRELATAYERVGRIQGNSYHSNIGDTEGGMKSYLRSLEIRQQLVERNPANDELRAELGESLEGVGDMEYTLNNLEPGLDRYLAALEIRQARSDKNPGDPLLRYKLAENLRKVGDITGLEGYPNLGDINRSIENYQKAVAIGEELVAEVPDSKTYRNGYSNWTINLAMLQSTVGDNANSIRNGQKAIALMEKTIAEAPNNEAYRMNLLSARNAIRFPLVGEMRFDEAAESMKSTIDELEKMSSVDPKNSFLKRSLGVSYNGLGRTQVDAGDPGSGIANHQKALKISQALKAADPENGEHARDIAYTLEFLGNAELAAGEHAAALGHYREALALISSPTSTDDVSNVQAGIAKCLAAGGSLAEAAQIFRDAAPRVDQTAERAKHNVRTQTRVAGFYFEAAKVISKLAETRAGAEKEQLTSEAAAWLQKSSDIFGSLNASGRLSKLHAHYVEDITKLTSKLG